MIKAQIVLGSQKAFLDRPAQPGRRGEVGKNRLMAESDCSMNRRRRSRKYPFYSTLSHRRQRDAFIGLRWRVLRDTPEALAYFFAYAPEGTSLAELAGAAGLRWTIEECFLRAKDDLGLDHCEARSWHGWHRHMSLVMASAAFLAKLSADQRRTAFGKRDKTSPNILAAA